MLQKSLRFTKNFCKIEISKKLLKEFQENLRLSKNCFNFEIEFAHFHKIQKKISQILEQFYNSGTQDRPIYRALDGRSYLRSYATFWVVSKNADDMNFMFYVEDSATCPNFVSQTGWEYVSSDMASYSDNRIRLDCVQRKEA